jgi:hypothetical protein
MAQPEPVEDDTSPAPTPPAESGASGPRPEWLVGAEEGMQAELQAEALARPTLPPAVALHRPAAPDPAAGGHPAPAPPPRPVKVPAPAPEDSAVIRGFEFGARPWTDAGSPVEKLRPEPPGQAVAPVEEARPPLAIPKRDDFPADDRSPPRSSPRGVPRANAPREPWLRAALEQLRTDRATQLAAAGAVLVLIVACAFLVPRPSPTVPLSWLKRSPQKFDGRLVQVSGKVGEVFPVGGGFAFNLIQGRDTIVVFTRTSAPEPRHHVKVAGTVSTGYLDGVPRLAIFAEVEQ